jgi:hypothetical protein
VKKFWQTEWQGIQFSDFTKLSSTKLADADFYNAFYQALFQRFSGYQELDLRWRDEKDTLADWIALQLPDGSRALSVGCGLGYMEQKLFQEHGSRIELHVSDYATDALCWLREVIPAERIHDPAEGGTLDRLNFQIIYLSAVDYAFDDKDLAKLLSELRGRLSMDGCLVIVSASYLDYQFSLIRLTKELIKAVLDKIGLRSRGQFWGWCRTRDEYRSIMRRAGFDAVEDDFIKCTGNTYWISGKV